MEILKQTAKANLGLTAEHVHIIVHENAELDVEDMKAINAAKDELVGTKPYSVIFQAPRFGNVTPAARQFAASEECYHNAIAKAIVTSSTASRIIGNFFIRFHRPPAPTKIFDSVESACAWLNELRSLHSSRSYVDQRSR